MNLFELDHNCNFIWFSFSIGIPLQLNSSYLLSNINIMFFSFMMSKAQKTLFMALKKFIQKITFLLYPSIRVRKLIQKMRYLHYPSIRVTQFIQKKRFLLYPSIRLRRFNQKMRFLLCPSVMLRKLKQKVKKEDFRKKVK